MLFNYCVDKKVNTKNQVGERVGVHKRKPAQNYKRRNNKKQNKGIKSPPTFHHPWDLLPLSASGRWWKDWRSSSLHPPLKVIFSSRSISPIFHRFTSLSLLSHLLSPPPSFLPFPLPRKSFSSLLRSYSFYSLFPPFLIRPITCVAFFSSFMPSYTQIHN